MMYCQGRGCLFRNTCARYTLRLKLTDIDRMVARCKQGRRYIQTNDNKQQQ